MVVDILLWKTRILSRDSLTCGVYLDIAIRGMMNASSNQLLSQTWIVVAKILRIAFYWDLDSAG